MADLQALIFDVDGTLADTERDGHRVAFNMAFEKAGLDWIWSVERYGQLLKVTGGKERIRYYLDEFNQGFKCPENLDEFIAELHASKTIFYTKLLAEGSIPLRTGVMRLINEAREAGLRLAIATTTTPANVAALLQHSMAADAENWFEVIAAGDIVPAKKPASDIYDLTLKQMNLSAQACLAFEDSHNGILSSMAAGLATIITVNDYTWEHDFNGAALVLDHMGEPDQPFKVLAGNAYHSSCLDLDLLKKIHLSSAGITD